MILPNIIFNVTVASLAQDFGRAYKALCFLLCDFGAMESSKNIANAPSASPDFRVSSSPGLVI